MFTIAAKRKKLTRENFLKRILTLLRSSLANGPGPPGFLPSSIPYLRCKATKTPQKNMKGVRSTA